jgi:hypothetical protein
MSREGTLVTKPAKIKFFTRAEQNSVVRFEVFVAVIMKNTIFWDDAGNVLPSSSG